jgi:rod shape-determining protein MreD
MTVPLLLYSLVGLGLFYLQNLAFFPHVRLRLLALLLFYVGLRPSLSLALGLGIVLGLLQDSYAATPFGLHLGASLLVVAAARFCRRRFLVQRPVPQMLASLVTLLLQEAALRGGLMVLGFQSFSLDQLIRYHSLEIVATVALGPALAFLVLGLEKLLSRWGWRALRDAPLAADLW